MCDEAETLVDGRTLVFANLGESGGPVVVDFPGAPTSGLDLVAFAFAKETAT